MVGGVGVNDGNVMDCIEVTCSGQGGVDVRDARIETTTQQSHQTFILKTLLVIPLPAVFELRGLHLSRKGFAVPAPMQLNNGQFVFEVSQQHVNKFGVLVPKFEGRCIDRPDVEACQDIAIFTAKMHKALSDFPDANNIQHSFKWCKQLIGELSPLIPEEDLQVLNLALTRYQAYQALIDECPAGVVHGDLFRDNVLFENREISGVIDFYNAGKTAFLFDLAVIANDWAVNFEYLPDLFSSNEPSVEGLDLQNIYDEQKL